GGHGGRGRRVAARPPRTAVPRPTGGDRVGDARSADPGGTTRDLRAPGRLNVRGAAHRFVVPLVLMALGVAGLAFWTTHEAPRINAPAGASRLAPHRARATHPHKAGTHSDA